MDWRQRQENERALGRFALLALFERYGIDLRWDADSGALIIGSWVTIYPPEAPENESGQWEVWTDSVSYGVRYRPDGTGEPDTVDSDLHKAWPHGDQALRTALDLVIRHRIDAEAEAIAEAKIMQMEIEEDRLASDHPENTTPGRMTGLS